MKRIAAGALLLAALAAFSTAALAKKAKPAKPAKGTALSFSDARSCIGQDNSTAVQQIAACTKVLNSGKVVHPYESEYLAARGAAYNAIGQSEKALADLNKALSIRQLPEFYFQRGIINMARSDIPAGKADFDQVIKLRPDYAPGYQMRGLASFIAGEYQDALTFFNGAVERVPTYYQALFARGVTKKKLGDDSGGDKDIKAARGMSPHVDKDMAPFGVKP